MQEYADQFDFGGITAMDGSSINSTSIVKGVTPPKDFIIQADTKPATNVGRRKRTAVQNTAAELKRLVDGNINKTRWICPQNRSFPVIDAFLIHNQQIFGVQPAQELYPPVELPAQVGLHYFRVMRGESARLWDRIQQEKTIAVRWPGVETSDFEITLYMTVPDTEAQ